MDKFTDFPYFKGSDSEKKLRDRTEDVSDTEKTQSSKEDKQSPLGCKLEATAKEGIKKRRVGVQESEKM